MSELGRACIEKRDAIPNRVILDTCGIPQMMDFMNNHPNALLLILIVLVLIMLASWIIDLKRVKEGNNEHN